jgi:DNA-binding transcriptional ArsR family regulator
MTIRVGQNAQGHHSHGMRRARLPVPPVVGTPEKRVGIDRKPRDRTAPDLPITEHHERVLEAMAPGEVISASKLAGALEEKKTSVSSALYVLADRGLVERVPYKGWRRTVKTT